MRIYAHIFIRHDVSICRICIIRTCNMPHKHLCVYTYIYILVILFLYSISCDYICHTCHTRLRAKHTKLPQASPLWNSHTPVRYVYLVVTQSMWQLHLHSTWTHYMDFWRPYFWVMKHIHICIAATLYI